VSQVLSAPLTLRLEERPNFQDVTAAFDRSQPLGLQLGAADGGDGGGVAGGAAPPRDCDCDELRVAEVEPGSQAAGAGVCAGMRARDVDGARVTSRKMFFLEIANADEGSLVLVRFTGGGDGSRGGGDDEGDEDDGGGGSDRSRSELLLGASAWLC